MEHTTATYCGLYTVTTSTYACPITRPLHVLKHSMVWHKKVYRTLIGDFLPSQSQSSLLFSLWSDCDNGLHYFAMMDYINYGCCAFSITHNAITIDTVCAAQFLHSVWWDPFIGNVTRVCLSTNALQDCTHTHTHTHTLTVINSLSSQWSSNEK